MPSAIQVKENEKRKHASLTIVGTKYDFALRLGRRDESHYTGALLVGGRNEGVLCN
jgi:uncharacterized membrane protein